MRWATLLLALAGCHGGLHARGEHQLLADVSYGIPAQGILGTDAPDARNVGARVSGGTFIEDRILIFVAGSYRRYDVDPGTAEAWEIQFGPRY
jgi:hypothetical protein